jgi:negative regulator of flagellin synthesis FlgM
MKITHNKVGQNLNLVDGAKTERAKNSATSAAATPANAKADALSELGKNSSAKVDVSPKAQEAKRIKELAMAAPDIDEAKVAKFRQLIDDGKYKVDAKAVADRLVDEHLAMEDLKG